MKKLLLATIIAGFVSTSVMAAGWVVGTVSEIGQYPGGLNIVVSRTADGTLFNKAVEPTSPYIKEILAMALTAKANGSDIEAYVGAGNTWEGFKVK